MLLFVFMMFQNTELKQNKLFGQFFVLASFQVSHNKAEILNKTCQEFLYHLQMGVKL